MKGEKGGEVFLRIPFFRFYPFTHFLPSTKVLPYPGSVMTAAPRVLIFGTFDGLHPGHRFVIERARERGSVSAVVARDANVGKIKGRIPRQTETQRAEAIRKAYSDVDVLLGDATDFLVPVRSVKPDLILLGYDQRLPPGVTDADFPCPVERLPGFQPEKYKSSLL